MAKEINTHMRESYESESSRLTLGLYVHIPFCRHKCEYCDFNSGPFNKKSRRDYLRALQDEILTSPWKLCTAKTIYFGGGTPSELSVKELRQLVTCVDRTFNPVLYGERTIECNPDSLNLKTLTAYKNMHFNRISLGIQSFNDQQLHDLGRTHSSMESKQCYKKARRAGFQNINIDLLFALPGQTLDDWKSDLHQAISLAPEHLSLYGLTIEPKTLLGSRFSRGKLPKFNENLEASMYELAMDLTKDAGYQQYEISSYAKPGRQCSHNLIYWHNQPYLGFGLSAASFINGSRWTNTGNFSNYWSSVQHGSVTHDTEETLAPEAALREEIMLELRTTTGFSTIELSSRYSLDVADYFKKTLDFLDKQNLITRPKDRVQLTRRGKLLADEVCLQFLT